MKSIFITVGTTPFDELIQFCDEHIDTSKFKVFAQISSASIYKPKYIEFIDFTNNIQDLYRDADIIISHAGAGSVYNLLELNKKVIFVPNFTMKDNHQEDICRFIKDNNYATVINVRDNIDLNKLLLSITTKTFNKYSTIGSKELIADIFDMIK